MWDEWSDFVYRLLDFDDYNLQTMLTINCGKPSCSDELLTPFQLIDY